MARWAIDPDKCFEEYSEERTVYRKGGHWVSILERWRVGGFTCRTEGNMFPDLEKDGYLYDLSGFDYEELERVDIQVESYESSDEEIQEQFLDCNTSEILEILEDEGWICGDESNITIDIGVKIGSISTVERLDGPNAGIRYDRNGEIVDEDTPDLLAPVRKGKVDKVHELITAGADVQTTNKGGRQPS